MQHLTILAVLSDEPLQYEKTDKGVKVTIETDFLHTADFDLVGHPAVTANNWQITYEYLKCGFIALTEVLHKKFKEVVDESPVPSGHSKPLV